MIPSIQLLGIEMLLHFLMGSEVLEFAKQNKLVLSLGIRVVWVFFKYFRIIESCKFCWI